MKILLFGKNGQVGWELNRSLQPLGEIVALGREEADFSKPESLRKIVREIKPDVIVNAAAYTTVDEAESDSDTAMTVNGHAPGVIAEEGKRVGALVVHYSTDYIFDGEKRLPYVETDQPNPINEYGRSKLEGERVMIASGCDYLILRSSWVFTSRGKNFLLSILKLAREKQELNIVDDQIGSPTWAGHIADITEKIIQISKKQRLTGKFVSGVYNIASSGETTWFGFTREILKMASSMKLDGAFVCTQIHPITSDEYPTPARRPRYSVLSTEKAEAAFGLTPIHWKDALKCCMATMS